MNPKELSEWFYWKSCYYHGVCELDKSHPKYIRAYIKFMWLCFMDWVLKPSPTTEQGKESK